MNQQAKTLIGSVVALELAYAVTRYHAFKGLPWALFPLYTVNKVMAWAGLTLLALAITSGPVGRLTGRVPVSPWAPVVGRAGAVLVAVHVLLSVLLSTPAYFGAWFDGGGRLLLWPAVGLVVGVAAAVMLWAAWRDAGDDVADAGARRLRTIVVALTAVHTATLGFESWLAPAEWPGLLPPITLLSCIIAVGAVVLRRLGR